MCSLKLALWAHSVQHGCLHVEQESNPLWRSRCLLLLLWKIWKTQVTVLQNTAAIPSRSFTEFAGLITKSVTHSCDGGSDFSTLRVLELGSGNITASSFFESARAGCGASIIIEFRICKHSQCVAHAGNSHQWWEWPFSHLELSPQENLTVRQGSIQRHPLIQDQLWFGEQLPHRDYKRSHWLVPRTRKLHRNTERSKGKRWTRVCGTYGGGPTLTTKQQLPSRRASPPWDHEPRSGRPRSRWVILSDHTPSKKNRGDINTVKSRLAFFFYILAQRGIDIFPC